VSEPEKSAPALSYATQPLYDRLIITRTAVAVLITVLPDRREAARALIRFILVVLLAGGLLWAAWYVRADRLGLLVATPIAVVVACSMLVKFVTALRPIKIVADSHGLNVASGFIERYFARELITDLVETARHDNEVPVGVLRLQLRLNNGENVMVAQGSAGEVRHLTMLLREALGL
jgi:hypothetical protein